MNNKKKRKKIIIILNILKHIQNKIKKIDLYNH